MQNPDPIRYPSPELSSNNTVRMGDSVFGLTGNVRFSRGTGGSGDEAYRLQPTVEPAFVANNNRDDEPADVGGDIKVASVNVLNYFNDLDDGTGQCFPSFTEEDCRGADSVLEFERQSEKLVTALSTIDADVVGLQELENDYPDGIDSSIAELVARLNAAGTASCSNYAYADTRGSARAGDDAIAVGIIYCTDTVALTEGTTVEFLDDSNLPDGFRAPIFSGDATNRAPLAATFTALDGGATFTVAVNHYKSKGDSGLDDEGSSCLIDPVLDPNCDQGDGAGFWDERRTDASAALLAWLDTDPTGGGDARQGTFILGDLNSYLNEDPVIALESGGFRNIAREFVDPYTFVFDAQAGTLDYVMVNNGFEGTVTGSTIWHANADEPDALDYNLNFGRNPNLFDGSIPFRASDHDSFIVGVEFAPVAPLRCDVDGNGQIDRGDISGILGRRNQPASGADDPADADGDGVITVLDARQCVSQCTNARCAP